jgi:hypothetical protein
MEGTSNFVSKNTEGCQILDVFSNHCLGFLIGKDKGNLCLGKGGEGERNRGDTERNKKTGLEKCHYFSSLFFFWWYQDLRHASQVLYTSSSPSSMFLSIKDNFGKTTN